MLVVRDEFIKALGRVKPALGEKDQIQALKHFWFENNTIRAYDGGFGIKLTHKHDLECGLPGAALLGLLSTSALKEASLEENGSTVSIKLGKSTSKLSASPAGDIAWPFPAKVPRDAAQAQLGEEFIEALRKTLFIKASPATRVEHHGVIVQKVKDALVLYSTDSSTLASVTLPGLGKKTEFDKVLLPRAFAEEIVAQTPEGVDLMVADHLFAGDKEISFYSNLLDLSEADDLAEVVRNAAEGHPEPVPLPPGLDGALARAEILAGKEEPAVTLSVSKGALHVSGDYGLGALQEALPLEKKHPDATIRARAGLLRRGLTYAENFSLTKKSLRFTSEPEFVYLVAALND